MFPYEAPKAALSPLCPGIAGTKRSRSYSAAFACALSVSAALALALATPARAAAGAADAPGPAASAARSADSCVAPTVRAPAKDCVSPPSPCRPADTCLPLPAARPRAQEAGDPFTAAALGALPLVSGFYLSASPIKGAAFTLADLMLIGAIIQIRSDANRPPKDAVPYYWLLAGTNLADAVLSVLQVRSEAAQRLSVNINPSDRPGILLGWRF